MSAQGLTLVRIFEDRRASGNRSDRPGLTKMLEFLEGPGPRPSRVIVESADRLARDLRVFVDLWDALGRLGAELFDTKNGRIDVTLGPTPFGASAARGRDSLQPSTGRRKRESVAPPRDS